MAIDDVISAFGNQRETAEVIEFTINRHSIPSGGHLQGIQRMDSASGIYFIISGSSDYEAYFIVVGKVGDGYGILQKNIVASDPYRHAGGIQIMGSYLVVGIEDNVERNKSKVYIFDISKPEKPVGEPIISIQREGKEKLATAGAVAIAKRPSDHLLMVGSWDSDTLDFYRSNGADLEDPECEFAYWRTWKKDHALKQDWCDHIWGNYQNLNLIRDEDYRLFLVGYYCSEEKEDYAHLYSLNTDKPAPEMLVKLSSKLFRCTDGVSFQYGGGIYIDDNGNLASYACGRNCRDRTVINEFR